MRKRKYIFPLIIVLVLICISLDSSAQCAMCKAAAESDLESNSKSIARGLNKGILFLMAAPYLIAGVIFRKQVVDLFTNLKEKRKQPLTKEQKQWVVFGLSVSSLWMILFFIYLYTQY